MIDRFRRRKRGMIIPFLGYDFANPRQPGNSNYMLDPPAGL
jgi:hypothetical protein